MAIYNRLCRRCGVSFEGGPRSWYCPDCRKQRGKERAKKYRKNGFQRHLGDTDYCRHCGKPYIVQSGQQRFCKECGEINHKLVDAQQSLSYYRKNKDAINPARNERRRELRQAVDRKCVVCGNLFKPKGKQLTCSKECRREMRNTLNRKIYDPRRRWALKHPEEE